MKNSTFLLSLIFCLLANAVSAQNQQPFVTVKGVQFYKGDQPYSFVGANYWYGGLLGSEKKGDRKRLLRELDLMKKNGIDNLRVLVGADGGKYDYTVTDALQTQQGVYDEELFDGLDFFLAELGKRDMYAVLYLTNNWEWSGGMSQYLEWNGYGEIPNPNTKPENTWDKFMGYVKQFHSCAPCMDAFSNHIKHVLGRTNRYTQKKYTEDPAIMSWQVANEPRIFTTDNEKAFLTWLNGVVGLIDSLDANHLISTGSEGRAGSNDDLQAFFRTHYNPKIDYLTMHIWPKNWSWFKADDAKATLPVTLSKTLNYIDEHIQIAELLKKPIVIEEFGLPRAHESLSPTSSTSTRLVLYSLIFDRLAESHKNGEALAGVNFWGFGGEGVASNAKGKWNTGDAYTADPPQEPQGLNTVFSTDESTLDLIKEFNSRLKK